MLDCLNIELVRRISLANRVGTEHDRLLTREWLVTNGLGGYATGTIAGVTTRRYHGLLVAGLPAPFGRTVMLSHLTEQIRLPDGETVRFGGAELGNESLELYGAEHLVEFRLEHGLPVWRYELEGIAIERQILMPHEQNTVHIIYRLVDGSGPIRLKLMPSVAFRPHEAPVSQAPPLPFRFSAVDGHFELRANSELPPLRLTAWGERPAFTYEPQRVSERLYRVERSRGYEATGDLWCPGYFRADLAPDAPVTMVASTEPWEIIEALSPDDVIERERERRRRLLAQACPSVRTGFGAELVLAADHFLVKPAGRVEDAAVARAMGDEVRTVIAGYHWFTDWGRDTMISLEGLTLTTGRCAEAGYILRTFSNYIRDGLLPNLFPEGEREGLYHTADATLWYFHAVDRYLAQEEDWATLDMLLPKLVDIVEHHLRGTRFGIGVDPTDGLLRQGEEGYQLTWMDAKVGDWVVTPRRGKAVEINALWYNALRLLEGWLRMRNETAKADELAAHAERTRESFNRRFWYAEGRHLYDVVDGPDGDVPACRPNQVFAISMKHPVLDRSRWEPVMETVQERLLTPMGLRSLAPGHPDYKPQYYGDLRARDAAYHQGTVWGWLIGPFVDAWLKLHPDDRQGARCFLEGFQDHSTESCVGSISEIFDAEAPYTPRGCIAQAWSVAEVLRCWALTAEEET